MGPGEAENPRLGSAACSRLGILTQLQACRRAPRSQALQHSSGSRRKSKGLRLWPQQDQGQNALNGGVHDDRQNWVFPLHGARGLPRQSSLQRVSGCLLGGNAHVVYGDGLSASRRHSAFCRCLCCGADDGAPGPGCHQQTALDPVCCHHAALLESGSSANISCYVSNISCYVMEHCQNQVCNLQACTREAVRLLMCPPASRSFFFIRTPASVPHAGPGTPPDGTGGGGGFGALPWAQAGNAKRPLFPVSDTTSSRLGTAAPARCRAMSNVAAICAQGVCVFCALLSISE